MYRANRGAAGRRRRSKPGHGRRGVKLGRRRRASASPVPVYRVQATCSPGEPHALPLICTVSVMVIFSGAVLGMAESHGLFSLRRWSAILVPTALVFAGAIGVSASAKIQGLDQRYRASSGSGRRTPNSSPSPCEPNRHFCRRRPPTYNRAGPGAWTDRRRRKKGEQQQPGRSRPTENQP